MVYFQTKNPNLGKNLEGLGMENVVIFMTIWNILLPFGIIYGRLVCIHSNLVYFCRYGMFLDQDKNLATLVSEAKRETKRFVAETSFWKALPARIFIFFIH
jgi:hypothetical protein